jgi:hypothetical protein
MFTLIIAMATSSTPERSAPISAGWYAVVSAGPGSYSWSAWWDEEPTPTQTPPSQAHGQESNKSAATGAARRAIENNGNYGRAVEVDKSYAHADKIGHAGGNASGERRIYFDTMQDAAEERRTVAKKKSRERKAEVSAAKSAQPTARERIDAGAYWIAVMVYEGLSGEKPDFKSWGFTEEPPKPEWWREPAAPQRGPDAIDALTYGLAILGLLPGATLLDARRAYRKMALVTHPDRGGSADEFHRLTQAYDAVLLLLLA